METYRNNEIEHYIAKCNQNTFPNFYKIGNRLK